MGVTKGLLDWQSVSHYYAATVGRELLLLKRVRVWKF